MAGEPEPPDGPTGPGTVLLELGMDVGAPVLIVPADRNGAEIDISQARPARPGGTPQAVPPKSPAGR
jgi:hypothetical protein